MKRREFIRLGGFLTVSAAAMTMTGCDIVGDSSDTSASALNPELYPNPSRPIPAAATGSAWSFPQSVASGDPKSDSIILWARVVNDAAPSDPTSSAAVVDTAVTLKVVLSDDFTGSLDSSAEIMDTPATTVVVPAYADFDGTIRHKLIGLSADKTYYFQFKAGDVCSRIGRFKTAPASDSTRTVKFAFMSCQDWSANHWGAFTDIVERDVTTPADLDFVVHLGDYIYETDNGGVAGNESLHGSIAFPDGAAIPGARVTDPAPGGNYATTTDDYRYLYKLYRSDSRIQRMHERFPMVAVWDDHEFSDDAWQASETYSNVNAPQVERRRNANQAWFEFMPADVTFEEVNPSFQNIQLYRDMQFGQVLHLVMTDERLYKQDHLVPENTLTNPADATSQIGRINSRYLVPEDKMKYAEQLKNAASPNLTLLSVLGETQRNWWKTTMSGSTATWKVWGNEVSLLRMGLNGTNAIATLLALGFVTPLASGIGTAAGSFGGNMSIASAYVAATTFGASGAVAGPAAGAIHAALASGSAAMVGAGVTAGLTVDQATVAVTAYLGAYSATAGGASAMAATGAQAIAIGSAGTYFDPASDTGINIRNHIRANGISSGFYSQALSGDAATMLKVSAFFRKFVINGDQWDGYRAERANLMSYLLEKNIQNVVAVTGDLHANFAGTVYDAFAGEVTTVDPSLAVVHAADNPLINIETAASAAGTAAMVDLVCAGISSTSWFSYIKAAADQLDPTNSLIGKLVYVPVPIAAPANAFYAGSPAVSFTTYLNLLDYTMGKVLGAPTDSNAVLAANLAAQLSTQIKRGLAAGGVAEAALDGGAAYIQSVVAGSGSFASVVGLAKMLSALGVATNPWLSAGYVDTEAQGYAVVEASTTDLQCHFRKLNPIVGANAPSTARIVASTKTATITAGSKSVTMS